MTSHKFMSSCLKLPYSKSTRKVHENNFRAVNKNIWTVVRVWPQMTLNDPRFILIWLCSFWLMTCERSSRKFRVRSLHSKVRVLKFSKWRTFGTKIIFSHQNCNSKKGFSRRKQITLQIRKWWSVDCRYCEFRWSGIRIPTGPNWYEIFKICLSGY